jgi:Fructose-2,6-bisphosphatase
LELLLCRHGETSYNKNGLIQGSLDIELNENGRQQARSLADRVSQHEIDALYTSPYLRAVQTADIISDEIGVEKTPEDNLREVDQGDFVDVPIQDVKDAIEESDDLEHEWAPEGGESMVECRRRAVDTLRDIAEKHSGETVVAVAHGSFNKAAILGILGYSTEHFDRMAQDNCCLNLMRPAQRKVVQVNCTDHISGK